MVRRIRQRMACSDPVRYILYDQFCGGAIVVVESSVVPVIGTSLVPAHNDVHKIKTAGR